MVIAVVALAVSIVLAMAVTLLRRGGSDEVVLPPDVSIASGLLSGVDVVIDPGHGGSDPGAVSAGTTEASLNYRMASVLAVVVRQAGGTPWFTITSSSLRTDLVEGVAEPALSQPTDAVAREAPDVTLRSGKEDMHALFRRGEYGSRIARRTGRRTVFLSLHHDSAPSASRRGGVVLWDLREGTPPPLVRALTNRLSSVHLSRGRDGRHLGVLAPGHNTVTDRALVELATITNRRDRAAATDPTWRWRVARQLVAAIAESQGRSVG